MVSRMWQEIADVWRKFCKTCWTMRRNTHCRGDKSWSAPRRVTARLSLRLRTLGLEYRQPINLEFSSAFTEWMPRDRVSWAVPAWASRSPNILWRSMAAVFGWKVKLGAGRDFTSRYRFMMRIERLVQAGPLPQPGL